MTGRRGLGKSMTSPAMLFTMGYQAGDRNRWVCNCSASHLVQDPHSLLWLHHGPHCPGPGTLTFISSSMYWLEIRGSVARVNSTDPRGPRGTRPAEKRADRKTSTQTPGTVPLAFIEHLLYAYPLPRIHLGAAVPPFHLWRSTDQGHMAWESLFSCFQRCCG